MAGGAGGKQVLITQDLDFSDTRQFVVSHHADLLLVRLHQPGILALSNAITAIASDLSHWGGCFVVLTDHKIRINLLSSVRCVVKRGTSSAKPGLPANRADLEMALLQRVSRVFPRL